MAEVRRQVSPSRITLLELKDERRLVEEGFELLDEKRMLLAARIRHELDRYRRLRREFDARYDHIRDKFATALAQHGLEEIDCMPTAACSESRLALVPERFLNLELVAVDVAAGACALEPAPVTPAPLIEELAHLEHQALECGARLAASEASLKRLLREYTRTERRARALENILLPEVRATERYVAEQLDGVDQEDAVRVRHGRSTRPGTQDSDLEEPRMQTATHAAERAA